ncbi:MAG: poly(A) polymerase [Thiotrichales bacterium]|nr:MAG: poly(A) polymerase [Thiotrichales bacterium]
MNSIFKNRSNNFVLPHNKINERVFSIIKTLQDAGFEAYIVGGGVRDLLLNLAPKDFDIATNATPTQIKSQFKRKCILIGKRFRLAHIFHNRHTYEVATFRANSTNKNNANMRFKDSGIIARDNVFGTIEEDVYRRDFTVNALYYDPTNKKLLDFVDAMQDIKNQNLRLIGDAKLRYTEDPVRILRAIRFANKLGFSLEADTKRQIQTTKHLLGDISPARLYEEYRKLFFHGKAFDNFKMMREYGLLQYMFGDIESALNDKAFAKFVELSLKNTDSRIKVNKTVNTGFLLAVFLWPEFTTQWNKHKNIDSKSRKIILDLLTDKLIKKHSNILMVNKYVASTIKGIWHLQHTLESCGARKMKMLTKDRFFRAANDFLLLRKP